MSQLIGIARVAAVSTTTSPKTLVQIVAPANQRLRIREIGIGFHGLVNTDPPVTVDICQQDTAGTSSSLTPVKEDETMPETLQSTARQTVTVEPSTSTPIRTFAVHPQTSLVLQFPPGEEIVLGGGKRLGIRTSTSTSQTADAYIRFEE